jgi:predicted nicotinamide N-methyase
MTTAKTSTASRPSILAVVEWDHEGHYNQNEQTTQHSLTKIRLENGSLSHPVERIRKERLDIHHRHDDDVANMRVEGGGDVALFLEISIYDWKVNSHRILYRGDVRVGGEDDSAMISALLDPAAGFPLQKQPQQQNKVEEDEDLTKRFGRRWRLQVVSIKESNGHEPKKQRHHHPLLAIQGRSYAANLENLVIAGKTLHIQERWNDQSNHTAFTVWDASLVLARYMEENPNQVVQGKNVLELGAGCGVAGLAAACCGAEHVSLTDRPEIVPHLQANVDANGALWTQDFKNSTTIKSSSSLSSTRTPTVVTCQALDWFQPPLSSSSLAWSNGRNVDVILVSDCVWTLDLVEPLLNTLRVLTESTHTLLPESSRIASLTDKEKEFLISRNGTNNNKSTNSVVVVLIAYQRRGFATHQAFWKGMRHLFQVETLPSPPLLLVKNDEPPESAASASCSSGSKIELFQCTRKR